MTTYFYRTQAGQTLEASGASTFPDDDAFVAFKFRVNNDGNGYFFDDGGVIEVRIVNCDGVTFNLEWNGEVLPGDLDCAVWHSIAVTNNGGESRIWYDGVEYAGLGADWVADPLTANPTFNRAINNTNIDFAQICYITHAITGPQITAFHGLDPTANPFATMTTGFGYPEGDAFAIWTGPQSVGTTDVPDNIDAYVLALVGGALAVPFGAETAESKVPRNARPTYPAVGAFYMLPGTDISYLRTLGPRVARDFFPSLGGFGIATAHWFIRRPESPVVTTGGTIVQIAAGDSLITVALDTDDKIVISADDGTGPGSPVSDTSTNPIVSGSWVAMALVSTSDDRLVVYVEGEAVAEVDVSSLEPPASDDYSLSFSIGAEADGSLPLDFDAANIVVWPEDLSIDDAGVGSAQLGDLGSVGPFFDIGNSVGVWVGPDHPPTVVWVEPITSGSVPDASAIGDEPLLAIGDVDWNPLAEDIDPQPSYDFGFFFGHPSELPSDDAPGSGTGSLSLWHMPSGTGYPSGSGATQDGSTALSDTVQAGWSALFWMRVTQSDEGAWAIDFSNATFGGVLVTISASFASFVVDLVANNTEIFASAPTSDNIPTGSLDFYSVEIDGDGVSRMYRNAELIAETPATPAGPPPGEDDAFVFQAQNYNTLDVTNLMVLDRVLTSDERIALTAATAAWNYTDTFDDGLGHVWTGVSPAFYYPNGELTNSGDGGTCDIALIGSGSVITEGGESTETLSFGCYDFHDGSAMSYADPMAPGLSIVVVNRTGEFGNDGGAVVRLYSPSKFSHAGPYDVRLVDADGNYWPPMSQSACYSAVAGALDAVMANRSREYLEFALPKLPQGVYAIRLSWNGGMSEATFDEMITVVPADTSLESSWLVKGWR